MGIDGQPHDTIGPYGSLEFEKVEKRANKYVQCSLKVIGSVPFSILPVLYGVKSLTTCSRSRVELTCNEKKSRKNNILRRDKIICTLN
jgi:hypothetical protein